MACRVQAETPFGASREPAKRGPCRTPLYIDCSFSTTDREGNTLAIISTSVHRDTQKVEVYVDIETVADIKTAQKATCVLFGKPSKLRLVRGVFTGVKKAREAAECDSGDQSDYDLEEHGYPAIEVIQKEILYIINRHGEKIELVKKDDGRAFRVCFEVLV